MTLTVPTLSRRRSKSLEPGSWLLTAMLDIINIRRNACEQGSGWANWSEDFNGISLSWSLISIQIRPQGLVTKFDEVIWILNITKALIPSSQSIWTSNCWKHWQDAFVTALSHLLAGGGNHGHKLLLPPPLSPPSSKKKLHLFRSVNVIVEGSMWPSRENLNYSQLLQSHLKTESK